MERIHFFSAGGTIDKIYFDAKSDYQVGEPQMKDLLQQANLAVSYTITSVFRKDSLDLTEEDRVTLSQVIEKCPEKKVIVTHGTDTMIESAKKCLGMDDKTIVFTGAMMPALFRYSDACFNVGGAIYAVQCLPNGVYIAMNGRVFDPFQVRKNHAAKTFEEVEQ